MAQLLKVGGFDFSKWIRVAHEDGMDPANPDYAEPQFSGSTAFGEGQAYAGDAVSNRAMSFPAILGATSTDALYALIREANAALTKGALVEYRSGGASEISYLNLEAGRLDPQFEFFLDQNGRCRATLHLWTQPRAHTGTTRVIASMPMGSAAIVQFPATGVIGDVAALANLEVRVGSAAATSGRVIAWGIHPHPSFNAIHVATSGLAQAGATVRGASGAVGSQYTAIPVSPTSASGIAYTAFISPPDAHVGRHRVLAIGRSGLSGPIALYGEDRFGAVLGATALATQTDLTRWQTIDLGEVQVPSRLPGQEPVPTQVVNIFAGGASGHAVNASPGFHLNRLILIPLDHSAGILRTPGGRPALIHDSFKGFGKRETIPADTGQQWSVATGLFQLNNSFMTAEKSQGSYAMYNVASGAQFSDVQVSVGLNWVVTGAEPGPAAASGVVFEAWAKRQLAAASFGVWARLTLGPSQTLNVLAGNASGATVLASAGIASTLASGLYKSQVHTLVIRTLGGRADVWLATGAPAPTPILSVNSPLIDLVGHPAVRVYPGGTTSFGAYLRAPFIVSENGATAVDIGPRESFRFESYPEKRVLQGNASVFKANRLGDFVGNAPQIAPVGSPAATGPAQVVVFQGEIDNVIGNDGLEPVLGVRERFKYLR